MCSMFLFNFVRYELGDGEFKMFEIFPPRFENTTAGVEKQLKEFYQKAAIDTDFMRIKKDNYYNHSIIIVWVN